MKKIILLFTLIHIAFQGFTATFYSQGSLDPTVLSSWNTVRTGGGTAPASFTTAGDVFIVQAGHSMVTTRAFTIGGAGSVLRIEGTGNLEAAHAITLTGQFEIMDGGTYVHNNNSVVTIFNGTEVFSANANVEFRNWATTLAPLPADIEWGNIIFNLYANFAAEWNLEGSLSNIQNDLKVMSTGKGSVALTGTTNQQINIGNDLIIENGLLILKTASDAGTSSLVQVERNILVNGGELNLGNVDFIGNNDLRFKGDLLVDLDAAIQSSSNFVFIVANGTASQSINSTGIFNVGLIVNKDAVVVLEDNLYFEEGLFCIIAGTVEAGMNVISLPEGRLYVPGGTLNSSVGMDLVNSTCTICSGDGTNDMIEWCKSSGDQGTINLTSGVLLFGTSNTSNLLVGTSNSPGSLYAENATISFDEQQGGTTFASVILGPNSTLSLDPTSVVQGHAFYEGNGGKLIIGSTDGIYATEEAGSITISGSRNYSASGNNSFEFKTDGDQYTGDGLPTAISGDLIINNLSGFSVNLLQPISIYAPGKLVLLNGYLGAVGDDVVTIENGSSVTGGSNSSFVDGRLIKRGNTAFTFPVGKAGRYAPVTIENINGEQNTDLYSAEYFPGNPRATRNGELLGNLQVISSIEYWEIEQVQGAGQKQITLPFGSHSGVSQPSSLVIAYYDDVYWQNYGQTAITGNASGGTITTTTPAFGAFTLGSTSTENSLPVRLVRFNVNKQGASRLVQWEISPEEKAMHFEVMLSADNRNYKSIGRVNASGSQLHYSFTDNGHHKGVSYYKLMLVGVDGDVSYSKVVVVFNEASDITLASVAPSVTNATSILSIISSKNQRMQVVVTNSHGQLINMRALQLKEGENQVQINLSNYSPGLYFIMTIDELKNKQTLKLIRQ